MALAAGSSAQVSDLGRRQTRSLDDVLRHELSRAGFTGCIEESLEGRLGRPIDIRLADLGRLVFFDQLNGIYEDNSCAGCHAPMNGFGDTQSIAIGVGNNGVVGPNRRGARNQRKAPIVINSGFYPKLMLNGRFQSLSGDPFDGSQGFQFPPPEGAGRFPANDPNVRTLLAAQGHIPQTELVEMAGFTGTAGTIAPHFDAFDDGEGTPVPPPDASGFRNEPIRDLVLGRFNEVQEYLDRFGEVFNGGASLPRGGITFAMIGSALAEFELSLTFANAPIDRFARGESDALTPPEKQGALLFFGRARCVACHAVGGRSNEMFSDFENHVLGVPQIAPYFGVGTGNVVFDGPGQDEDFGAEQVTGDPADRYEFRTSPLRNVAVQPAFFHNGAFTHLEDAIRHHMNVVRSARTYDPVDARVDADLTERRGPTNPVLRRLDPLVAKPISLSPRDFDVLVAFVRNGLLDPRALPTNLCGLVPVAVPSGIPVARFEGCE
jgi:cytochrome c peroxidase